MFNIENAINWSKKNICQKSTGKCATYVRRMLEAGGLDTTGRPVAACNYVNFLPSIGFKLIATLSNRIDQTNFSKTQAKAGDVAVMSHGKYGHICMFNGTHWVSDFRQNNMWPYSGNGVCNIYRYC